MVVKKFTGLNTSPNEIAIPEDALTEAVNVDIQPDGSITRRKGIKAVYTFDELNTIGNILEVFRSPIGFTFLVHKEDTNLNIFCEYENGFVLVSTKQNVFRTKQDSSIVLLEGNSSNSLLFLQDGNPPVRLLATDYDPSRVLQLPYVEPGGVVDPPPPGGNFRLTLGTGWTVGDIVYIWNVRPELISGGNIYRSVTLSSLSQVIDLSSIYSLGQRVTIGSDQATDLNSNGIPDVGEKYVSANRISGSWTFGSGSGYNGYLVANGTVAGVSGVLELEISLREGVR